MGISLPQLPLQVRSCEVAINWPDPLYTSELIPVPFPDSMTCALKKTCRSIERERENDPSTTFFCLTTIFIYLHILFFTATCVLFQLPLSSTLPFFSKGSVVSASCYIHLFLIAGSKNWSAKKMGKSLQVSSWLSHNPLLVMVPSPCVSQLLKASRTRSERAMAIGWRL